MVRVKVRMRAKVVRAVMAVRVVRVIRVVRVVRLVRVVRVVRVIGTGRLVKVVCIALPVRISGWRKKFVCWFPFCGALL